LSELKARAAAPGLTSEEILITSDTVVQLEGDTLEKPGSPEEAMDMIRRLSGKTHEVTTAFTIVDGSAPDMLKTDHDTVKVSFLHLSDEFIQHYVSHHQPFDKAGAYGAQDLIGACGIHTLEGSFYTVMGLPMHKIFSTLQALD
jgi:septum formation protein